MTSFYPAPIPPQPDHPGPGCVEPAAMQLVARCAIAPDERLSIDYGATEGWLGRQVECGCGAPSCRAWIMGRNETPGAEGRAALARRSRGA